MTNVSSYDVLIWRNKNHSGWIPVNDTEYTVRNVSMSDAVSIDVREAVSGKNFSLKCEGISYFVYCTELSNDNGFEKKTLFHLICQIYIIQMHVLVYST